MSTRAGPFGHNILPCLIVGRKCISDTRKGGTKIDTHDQLGLAATGPFDLDGGVVQILGLRDGWRHRRRNGLLYPIPRRRAHAWHHGLGILDVGIERRRVVRRDLVAWGHGTGGSAVGVARGPAQVVLVGVHGKAGGRRTGLRGQGAGRGRPVGSWRNESLRRRVGDLRRRRSGSGSGGGGDSGLLLIAFRPKAERSKL